jgi:V/A-type H+-transporting ATPase subunit E
MAEDVQGLLDKIHNDGIAKAQQEKEAIIEAARKEAAQIVAEAKAQAEILKKAAQTEAQTGQDKANAAIRQAARDAVIALKADLLAKLNAVVHSCIGDAMTPEVMKQIILTMAQSYAKNANAGESLEVLISKQEQEQTQAFLKEQLLKELKASPVIELTTDFNSGLQISFRDSDVYFDFSDDALAEVICRFVGPKLTAVIKG